MAFRRSANSRIWSKDLIFCKTTSDVGLREGGHSLFVVFFKKTTKNAQMRPTQKKKKEENNSSIY